MTAKFYSETRVVSILRIRKSTLRKIEDEGIISPRHRLGQRYYTPEQVSDLLFARDLLTDMGVNLAGVEVALRMRRSMREMEAQMDQIFDYLKRRMEDEG